jgi:hypothetical protein
MTKQGRANETLWYRSQESFPSGLITIVIRQREELYS